MPDREPLISAEQAYTCLRAIGVGVPDHGTEQDPMPRAVALGFLLGVIEQAALLENDRFDLEGVRTGYVSAVMSAAVTALKDEDIHDAASFMWGRLLEDRVRRTALDLADTAAPGDGKTYTVVGAVGELLEAVLALLAVVNPPEGDGTPTPHDVRATAKALKQARTRVSRARQQIEDGRKTVRAMGYDA